MVARRDACSAAAGVPSSSARSKRPTSRRFRSALPRSRLRARPPSRGKQRGGLGAREPRLSLSPSRWSSPTCPRLGTSPPGIRSRPDRSGRDHGVAGPAPAAAIGSRSRLSPDGVLYSGRAPSAAQQPGGLGVSRPRRRPHLRRCSATRSGSSRRDHGPTRCWSLPSGLPRSLGREPRPRRIDDPGSCGRGAPARPPGGRSAAAPGRAGRRTDGRRVVLLWTHAGVAAVCALLPPARHHRPALACHWHGALKERRRPPPATVGSDARAVEVARLASDHERLLAEVLSTEERERARLAESLHDGPMQR